MKIQREFTPSLDLIGKFDKDEILYLLNKLAARASYHDRLIDELIDQITALEEYLGVQSQSQNHIKMVKT